jgi:hypothetical protein
MARPRNLRAVLDAIHAREARVMGNRINCEFSI